MSRLLISFLFVTTALTASSQRIYFIYFQTDPQRPFFIKMDEKLYSSTPSGYLILPRLKDSIYNFTIGFPGNQIPEQRFSCSIDKKDHGYLVKNFPDKGWGLVDLQTQSVQMASGDSKKEVSMANTPVNAFTELLAKAADDSTLKQKIVMAEEKKPEIVAKTTAGPEQQKEKNMTAVTVSQKEIIAPANPASASITKAQKSDSANDKAKPTSATSLASAGKDSERKDLEKGMITSIDTTSKTARVNKDKDTVRPVMDQTANLTANASEKMPDGPAEKSGKVFTAPAGKNPGVTTEAKADRPIEENVSNTGPATQMQNNTANNANANPVAAQPEYAKSKVARTSGTSTTAGFDMVFTDTYRDGTRDTIRISIPEESKAAPLNETQQNTEQKKPELTNSPGSAPSENAVRSIAKSNCKQVGSDADFYKLRKKMASGKSDAAMLDEANKVFKTKCFTSAQVKNLSSLFLGDGGKYSFFDAAYMHVSDPENFSSLESELKDEYFVNRFKAMLR